MEVALAILIGLLAVSLSYNILLSYFGRARARELKRSGARAERLEELLRERREEYGLELAKLSDKHQEGFNDYVERCEARFDDLCVAKNADIEKLNNAIKLFFRLSPGLARAFQYKVSGVFGDPHRNIDFDAIDLFLAAEADDKTRGEYMDLLHKIESDGKGDSGVDTAQGPFSNSTYVINNHYPQDGLPVRHYAHREPYMNPGAKLYSDDKVTTRESGE